MLIIKRAAIVLEFLGAVLLLLSITGFFQYHERIELYKTLQIKKEVPAESPVAQQLMKDYGFPDEQIKLIKVLYLKDLRFGDMGRSIAGLVIAGAVDGRDRNIVDLIEFREWAYTQSKTYDWVAFGLVARGLVAQTVVHVFEESSRGKRH
jgi:hypothetical protein